MRAADHGSTTVRAAVVALTAAIVVAAPLRGARAHVEAALDDNNRYVKLTPLGDRVRIAYTVFIGQRPGATLRRRLDLDRDGQISDAEAARYADEMARQVQPAITATLDGRLTPITWTTVDVGLGTPSVTGGAFSIDLVGWLCASGAQHRLVLRDTVQLDHPGETEVKLEDGPGGRFGTRALGGRPLDGLDAKWTGGDGPLTLGLEVAWSVDGAAPSPRDHRCAATRNAPRQGWRWGVLIGVGVLAAAGAAFFVRRRASGTRTDS